MASSKNRTNFSLWCGDPYTLNKLEDFILAVVEFLPDGGHGVHYLRQPFKREPGFGVTV